MMNFKRIYILSTAILLLAGAPTAAQQANSYTRAQMDSIVNPPVQAGADTLLRFHAPLQRIGTLSDTDSVHTYRFTFTNVSGRTQRISRVTTNCGCTAARFSRQSIAPGAKAEVSMSYNPKGRPGTIDTNAFVYLEGAGNAPVARLTLLGEVTQSDRWDYLPKVAGPLRLKRRTLRFTEVGTTGKPSMRLLCANTGSKPLRLSATMLPAYASFKSEPAVIAPGAEADLVLTIDAARLPANVRRFSFLIEGISCRLTERTIEVTIMR